MNGIANGTWVLIADGERALFTRNVTDEQNPHLVIIRVEEQDNPPTRNQSESAPGRRNDGPGTGRSAMEETDWHQLAKDRFAADLADMLYKRAHRGRYDHLVIVAPPRTLGELRDKMHSEVRSRVVGEIPKDLTNHPLAEIEKIVSNTLAGAAG